MVKARWKRPSSDTASTPGLSPFGRPGASTDRKRAGGDKGGNASSEDDLPNLARGIFVVLGHLFWVLVSLRRAWNSCQDLYTCLFWCEQAEQEFEGTWHELVALSEERERERERDDVQKMMRSSFCGSFVFAFLVRGARGTEELLGRLNMDWKMIFMDSWLLGTVLPVQVVFQVAHVTVTGFSGVKHPLSDILSETTGYAKLGQCLDTLLHLKAMSESLAHSGQLIQLIQELR